MIKQLCLAAAVATVLSSAAIAAEYYIVQEKSTKRCRIVETRPTETTWIQIGPLAFKTRDEAEKQVKILCKERVN
jgi:hypothetical protein